MSQYLISDRMTILKTVLAVRCRHRPSCLTEAACDISRIRAHQSHLSTVMTCIDYAMAAATLADNVIEAEKKIPSRPIARGSEVQVWTGLTRIKARHRSTKVIELLKGRLPRLRACSRWTTRQRGGRGFRDTWTWWRKSVNAASNHVLLSTSINCVKPCEMGDTE